MIAPKKVFFDCRSIIQCKQVFTMAFATPGRYPHCFVSTNVCGHRVCVSMYILVGVYIVVHKMMINEWNDAVRTSTHKTIRDLFTRFHVFRVAHMWECVCVVFVYLEKALANAIIVMWLRFTSNSFQRLINMVWRAYLFLIATVQR